MAKYEIGFKNGDCMHTVTNKMQEIAFKLVLKTN